jgi:hypothetical protein
MNSGRTHAGPFAEVRTLADVVLDSCKKSAHFLRAHIDLCVLAALVKTAPAGAMVKLRPAQAWRLLEELAAAGQDREKTRNALRKRAGEVLAQLGREMGGSVPAEALLAKLSELFLKELEA